MSVTLEGGETLLAGAVLDTRGLTTAPRRPIVRVAEILRQTLTCSRRPRARAAGW